MHRSQAARDRPQRKLKVSDSVLRAFEIQQHLTEKLPGRDGRARIGAKPTQAGRILQLTRLAQARDGLPSSSRRRERDHG